MSPNEDVTNITSLFKYLGQQAARSDAANDEQTAINPTASVAPPGESSGAPKYNLRQATTPSIHLPAPESLRSADETPVTVPRVPPGGSTSYANPANDATLVGNRANYQLVRQFAQGGCGEVWEGSQNVFPRVVALKKIRPDMMANYAPDEELKQQIYRSFLSEALTTAVLEHPNIVPVYDFSVDPAGEPLLAMRLIRGRRWDQLMYEDRDVPKAEYLERHLPILINVGLAVAYAHSKGVIHRDLKPSQVMIGEFGEVYLMDWGLALVVDEDLFFSDFPDLRTAGVAPTRGSNPPLGGTPAYMAPEQALMDPWQLSNLTDVFLLGSTFYYLLTGSPPRRSTAQELDASGLLALPIEAPKVLRPDWDLPEALGEICMRALEQNPVDRFPSARDFVEAIQAWLTGASKRRESVTLAAGAEERLATARGDYAVLLECQSALTRALGLWPENREASRLLQETIRVFAESALAKDDLNLARVMATNIRSPIIREELLNEVIANERLAKLAEAEAEEAEVQIRELQASGDMVQQELLNMESRLNGIKIAMDGLFNMATVFLDDKDGVKPAHLRHLAAQLLSVPMGVLPRNRLTADLYNRAGQVCQELGLEEEAASLGARAEVLFNT